MTSAAHKENAYLDLTILYVQCDYGPLLYYVHYMINPVKSMRMLTMKTSLERVLPQAYVTQYLLFKGCIDLNIKPHSYFNAMQLRYWYIDRVSTTAQHNAMHLKLKWMKYCNAVVGAEMDRYKHCNLNNADASEYEHSLSPVL